MVKTLATLVLLSVAASAGAQETVTIVGRDGSRTTGRFEAWNRETNTLYVRRSLADQQKIPLADAAVISVGDAAEDLPKDELARAGDDRHLLVLRSGASHTGRLTNIEGGEGSGKEGDPRVLSFAPASGNDIRVPFADVRRVYLGRVNVKTTDTLPDTDVPPGAVRVPAAAGWVATGITVNRGDQVQFTVTGTVQLSTEAAARSGSAGVASAQKAPDSPAPSLPVGALIGRVGNSAPFGIGDQQAALPMPASGQLFLAVNDDHSADNQGSFAVTIRVIRSR